MAERTVPQLIKGRDKAEQRRMQWLSIWKDAYRYTLPQRDITDRVTPGQNKGQRVYDSTSVSAAQNLANKLQAALFPIYQDFVALTPGPSIPEEIRDEAYTLLDQITKIFHAVIWRSNFSTAIGEHLLELVIGTGCTLVQEGPDFDPVRFSPFPQSAVGLEMGAWGEASAVYRKFKVGYSAAKEMWPDMKTQTDWEKLAEDDPDHEVEINEATYVQYNDGGPNDNVWYYEIWRDDSSTSGQKLLENPRTFNVAGPWLITRWSRAVNEVYGRGPVIQSLPDIRTANRVVELLLMNASLTVPGVYTVASDGFTNPNTAELKPGAFIPVQRNDGHPSGPSIAPLPRTGDFELGAFVLEDMRTNIKRQMFDRSLPDPQGTPPSATEVIARQRELSIETGPAFGRIMTELVQPLVIRVLRILASKKLIDFPVEINGDTVQVTVTSPLARQQALEDVESMARTMEVSNALVGPELTALNYRVEEIPNWIAQKAGMDGVLLRDDTNKAKLMEAVARQIAQITLEAQQAEAGQGAPGGAPAQANGAAA